MHKCKICPSIFVLFCGYDQKWQYDEIFNAVLAEVKMPSGNTDKPVIEDNRDGTISIRYEPREEGLHELYVKYNGEHVQGSPFKFHVDTIASGFVTAYGPGLTHGVSGEPCNFTISTKGAGAGT